MRAQLAAAHTYHLRYGHLQQALFTLRHAPTAFPTTAERRRRMDGWHHDIVDSDRTGTEMTCQLHPTIRTGREDGRPQRIRTLRIHAYSLFRGMERQHGHERGKGSL